MTGWTHGEPNALTRSGPDASAARRAAAIAVRLQATARHEAAVDMFDRAARLTGPARERARILVRGAGCAYAAGFRTRGDELVAAARRVSVDDDVRRIGHLLHSAFGPGNSSGHGHTWAEHLEATKVLLSWDQHAAAFGVLAAAPARSWRTTDVELLLSRSDRHARELLAGVVRLRGGRLSSCLPELVPAAEALHAAGEWGAAHVAYTLSAEAAVCLGQTAAAARMVQLAREIQLARPGIPRSERAMLVEAMTAARQGRTEDVGVAVTLRRVMLSDGRAERDLAELVCAVGLIGQERWFDAFDILAALAVTLDHSSTELVTWGVLGHLADVARHVGQCDLARRLVSDLGRVEGVLDDDVALAELLYATAVLSTPGRADACYQAFLSHDPARWPWLGARAHLAYGQQLRRARRVGDARGHLVTAQRVFAAMGVGPWERQVAVELRAAGVRHAAGRHDTDHALPLSGQELQIARLAARGLSNREIGQTLLLSPRTIGSHLYRIFPKLNVTSRVQLTEVLSRA